MFLRLLTFCMCVLTPRERTQGKDETFLCSLSTFDAYFVTRPHKSPKPFVFAVKSMDDLSFFENTADYLHVFSCGQKEGEKWVSQKKILSKRNPHLCYFQIQQILLARVSIIPFLHML